MVITVQSTKIKPGYKQTEIGVISEDWKVEKIGEIADIKTGPFGSALHEKDYVDDGTPIITVEHLSEQGVIYVNLPMVSDLDRKRLKAYILLKGDIVFSRVGSVDRNSLIKEEESGWLFSGRLLRIRLKTVDICSAFLSYYLNQEPTKQRIRSVAVGQTMPSLNTQILKNVEIAFPSCISEQQAIATALSDVDALITSLDKLIAKKRDIKQATMQQLLTGKRQLSGFSGEWEVKKLGDVFNVTAGGDFDPHESSLIQNEVYRYPIYSNALSNNGLYGFCSYNSHQAGSITVTARGTLGVANFRNHNFTAIGRVLVLQPNMAVDGRFFSEFINNQIDFVIESTGVPQLTAPQISKYQLSVPSLCEQTAIATILSDMDAEIAALEQKRDKTRALKQGMMQELLTGKTRLI